VGELGVLLRRARRAAVLAIIIMAMMATLLAGAATAQATGDDGTRSVVPLGPDLAVSAGDVTLSKPVLLADVPFNLTARVYNLGDVDAAWVPVDFLVDGELAGSTAIESVPKSMYADVTQEFTLAQGVHQVSIVVDAGDAFDEKREDNNAATVSLRVMGLPDMDISAADVTLSDPHPMEGAVVTIDAIVHNKGESQATLVVVQFWDGEVGSGTLIANRTTSIPSGGMAHVSAPWDTRTMGGTHYISVAATTVLPGEQDPSNNVASIAVLVFTQWDMVVDAATGDVDIDQKWTQDGFVTVRSGHTLTITGVEFMFLQDYPLQFALFVEDGATLELVSARVASESALLVVLEGSAQLRMREGSVLEARVELRGDATLDIEDAVQTGGMTGGARSARLHNATVTGPIAIEGCVIDASAVEFAPDGALALTGGRAVLRDCAISGGADPSLDLKGGADVELRNVTCGNVSTDAVSKAVVFRRIDILTIDESTLVIPGATLRIEHFINGTEVATMVGDADGWVQVDVVSDVIVGGQSHFIGNYRVVARFSTVESSTPLLLSPFPAMDARSNRPSMTVVLPPVPPRDLVGSTGGDMILEATEGPLQLVADFIQDGNIVVRGVLTISSSRLSVLQDRGHQFYVLVEGSGRLTLEGGTLTSERPINVYLYDDAQLVLGSGSVVAVNAIVAQDRATITASNSIIKARLLLRGGAVLLQGGCDIQADRIVVEVPTLKIVGGRVVAKSLLADSPSMMFDGVTISVGELEIRSTLVNITGSHVESPVVRVRATILTISGTYLRTEEPVHLNVSTFYADTSVLNNPLDELPESAKVYLYNAEIPRPFSLSNSTVFVYWYLTVRVQDALGNRIGGAAIEVTFTRNGTVVARGETNDDGEVRIPLLGSLVGRDGEVFVGNYKVVVFNPKDTGDQQVGYVGLDKGRELQVAFAAILLPPTGMEVEAIVDNTTVVAGTNFTVHGSAVATYPVGRRPLYEGIVTIKLLSNATPIWQNTTPLDQDGIFAIVVPAPERTGAYTVEVQVEGTGVFAGTEGRAHVIAIDIIEPAPNKIVVVLEITLINPFYLGNAVIVRGTVRYNDAQGRPVPGARVFVKDTPTMNTQQMSADGVGAFEYTYESPVNIGQWDYIVHAKDEGLNLLSETVKLTLVAVEPPKAKETGMNKILLGAVIAIVIAVVVVGAILGQMLMSSKGRMVECGQCGTLVLETAKVCTRCGTEFETDVAKCSECGSWIKSESPECPYCGTKFRDISSDRDEDEDDEKGGDGKKEGGEGKEMPVIAEVPDAPEGTVEGVAPATAPDGLSADASALASSAKRPPEGISGNGRPVVARKTVVPAAEPAAKASEGEVRPRVRKISKPPAQPGAGGEGEGGH
jgi:hypothetical protein